MTVILLEVIGTWLACNLIKQESIETSLLKLWVHLSSENQFQHWQLIYFQAKLCLYLKCFHWNLLFFALVIYLLTLTWYSYSHFYNSMHIFNGDVTILIHILLLLYCLKCVNN